MKKNHVKKSPSLRELKDLDSIGPAMLRDFKLLGVKTIPQLSKSDPEALYRKLSRLTGRRQDPCVLDTFTCAVEQAKNPNLPKAMRKWWYWSRLRLGGGRQQNQKNRSIVKKILTILLFIFLLSQNTQAEENRNFSILFHGGGGFSNGFLGSGAALPEGGLWLGISLSNQFDGLWGIDYCSLPNQAITFAVQPTKTDTATTKSVAATDDIALSVNTRWYLGNKYDEIHKRFNSNPYLVGGLGMDLVVDENPRPPNSRFYNAAYDALLAFNLGAGMDFSLGSEDAWFFYSEAMEHLIVWQGLTQVTTLRAGFKVMLDSEHLDPFR